MDAVWESLHSSRPWGKYPADVLVTRVMRQFKSVADRSQISVLEVGCGVGANLSFFVNEGFSVTGIDGSPTAIENAEKRLRPMASGQQSLVLRNCTFAEMDYPDDSFDLAVDYFALYCSLLADAERNIANIHRMVKPGGHFYQRTFGTRTQGCGSGTLLEPGTSENPTSGPFQEMGITHCFSLEELRSIYEPWSHVEITQTIDTIVGDEENCIERWEIWAQK